MTPKIACVIVTFNNSGMLTDLLQDLADQSVQPHRVIVVDNSTDYLTEKITSVGWQGVTYIKMTQNIGTAGGFSEGIKIAIEDCDCVLTLDDDVRMMANSLGELCKGLIELERQYERIGAVRGVGLGHDERKPTQFEYFAWRGTLIKAEAIRKAGLPDKSFFMYGDDLEYSLRLAHNGYQFFWIPNSVIFENRHGDKVTQQFLGGRLTFYTEKFRLYYALRNSIHMYKNYRRPMFMLRTVMYGVKLISFFCLYQRSDLRSKIRAIVEGIMDGIKSKLGKNRRYLPSATPVNPTDGDMF